MSNPHGGIDQLWLFDGDGTIRSKIGKVLDIRTEKTQPGTSVIP